MKKKLLSFALAATMMLSMPTALFAAETSTAEPINNPGTCTDGAEISPMSTTTSNVSTSRISNTKGSISAYGSFNTKATKASCTIMLQVKSNGSWVLATDLPVHTYVKNVTNAYSITASKTFTLKSGKVYRAKVVFSDTNSSGTYSKIHYSGSF